MELQGEKSLHYSESMMTSPPREAIDSERDLLPLPTPPTKWLNLSKSPQSNEIVNAPFPQKVHQIILYKCIFQVKESIYIFNLLV